MKYAKRGNYYTFQDYIRCKTGKPLSSLNKYPSYSVDRMDVAAARIMKAIKNREHIEVYTDYDADGIGSAVQIIMLFRLLGASNYNVRIPRRFSDGYGIQLHHVQAMPDGGLLIMADNGIKAMEAVIEAKRKGMDVIILDHHLSDIGRNGPILPNADIIIDPEVISDGSDFTEYCAAGLVNKLIHLMTNDRTLHQKAAAVAALSTVADVVPLKEDNRKIVQQGIWAMNHGMGTAGLQEIVGVCGLNGIVTSEDIAFKLAPMVNAPGRLYDTGGFSAAAVILEEDKNKALVNAAKMKTVNDNRKQQIKDAVAGITIDEDMPVMFVRADAVSGGLLGIVAGKIAEQTGKPAFVYKVSNGIATGSARSDDESQNNVEAMLHNVSDLLIKFGGHPGAAGFSFAAENEKKLMDQMMTYPVKPHTAQYFYDLDLEPEDAKDTLLLMDQAEPFGKDMERPVFRIEAHFDYDLFWKKMGDGTHISFMLPGKLKAVGFGLTERFEEEGRPAHMYLYGCLVWNWFKGSCSPNFRIDDLERI